MTKTDVLQKCIEVFDEKIRNLTSDIASLQTRLDMLKKCRSEFLYDRAEALTQEYLDERNIMYAEEPNEFMHWNGNEFTHYPMHSDDDESDRMH